LARFSHRRSLQKIRASLLAGTALVGVVAPLSTPATIVVAAVSMVSASITSLASARADGGAGGTSGGGEPGPGGVGGTSGSPTGVDGQTSGYGAGGGGGGNGAFGGTNNINFGSDGSGAAGRVGIVCTDLTIINSGTITGGLANAGAGAQANAITFTGGTNTLQIQAGSTINGTVVAFSAADTFVLGGTTNSTLNATLIGTRYQGFGVFDKTGTSTWTLNGGAPGQASTPWVISGGILKAGNAASVFGATSAITVTSPGTSISAASCRPSARSRAPAQ
jgi:hypothetical protein